MTTCYEIGDKLKGYIFYVRQDKIKSPKVIPKTGRHKAQRTVLKDNAEATILAKVKYLGE